MSDNQRISLDPRLSAIAEMVGRCGCYADIGCDHGRLGAFLLQSGWAREAVLTDISEPSLQKARSLIRLLGLEERTRFIVSDGAMGIDRSVDAVVIAGMGGATIAGILRQGHEKLGGARLILQANVANALLRAALVETGYAIRDERIARDGRRYYVIIEAVRGTASYSETELLAGPVLLRTRPAELAGYADFKIRVAKKALLGAQSGGDTASAAALEREKHVWEDVRSWL